MPIADWFRGDEFDRYAQELFRGEGLPLHARVKGEILRGNTAGHANHDNFLCILMLSNRFYRDRG